MKHACLISTGLTTPRGRFAPVWKRRGTVPLKPYNQTLYSTTHCKCERSAARCCRHEIFSRSSVHSTNTSWRLRGSTVGGGAPLSTGIPSFRTRALVNPAQHMRDNTTSICEDVGGIWLVRLAVQVTWILPFGVKIFVMRIDHATVVCMWLVLNTARSMARRWSAELLRTYSSTTVPYCTTACCSPS